VKIDDDADRGEYDVDIRVSKNGYDTETVSTSFDVVRGNNDSHDKGDNDVKDVSVSAAAAASSGSSSASGAASGASSSK
jgi:hypothetical protein